MLNVQCLKSADGGRTFRPVRTPHGDNHDLWIDPADAQRMIEGNDGGVNVSFDGGLSWTQQDNQPTAQFYHVVTDDGFPYKLYGAQQDNSTVAIPSRTDHGGIGRSDWYDVGGGESGFIAPKPGDPRSSTPARTTATSHASTIAPARSATSIRGPTTRWAGAPRARSTASNGRSRS